MGSYKIVLTEKAKLQLIEINRYISETLNETITAKKYVDTIKRAVLSLDEMPIRYKLIEYEPHHSRGIRKMISKNFYLSGWKSGSNGMKCRKHALI